MRFVPTPIAGVVVQKMVLPGQFIQAGTTAAFVISNTSTVWVQGHVYDKDLASVHVGDKVDERNASFPEPFHGVVSYIGDMLDRLTGGAYRSTPHRVRNISGKSRLSFPFFFDPGWDTDIVPLPAAANARDDSTERWDRANVHAWSGTYGDYLLGKVAKVFPELAAEVR